MNATDGMLSKVRALLDNADSYDTESQDLLRQSAKVDDPQMAATLAATAKERAGAADAYRSKAEAIMAKYAIDIDELLGSKTLAEGVLLPSPVPFDLYVTRRSPFQSHYAQLWGEVYRHVGLRSKGEWVLNSSGEYEWTARGVGFEGDVQYAEMLFTKMRMAFGDRLEPKVDFSLSDQENVYRLRSAGIERIRIADLLWGQTDKVFLGRVGRLYKAECLARGEEAVLSGRGVTGAAFREAYADGFVLKMATRLRQARSGGSGLVLGNREQVLNEAFYTRFPEMRPKAAVGSVGEPERCKKCDKAKSGICLEHRLPAAPRRGRDPYSTAAQRGRASGSSAALSVDLGRGTGGNQIGGA